MRSARRRTAPEARATNELQLSPPGATHGVGIDVEVGLAVADPELVPGEPVGLAGVQFAQVAVGHRAVPSPMPGAGDGRGLDGPGQHAGVQRAGTGQLAGRHQPVPQGLGLAPPGRRQTGAPLVAPDHARRRCTSPRRGG